MINIKTPPQITKIYLVENCYGDPNKVYVGKTIDSRKWSHLKKFGNNIIYTEIDEINSWNKKDWVPLECYWIEQFRQFGFELMNGNKGGGGPSFRSEETKLKLSKPKSEETKLKMSKFHKGKIIKEETKIKLSKPILQYDKEGTLIQEWPSIKLAQLTLNIKGISSCCSGKTPQASNYVWRYKNDPILDKFQLPLNKNQSRIIQYSLSGEYIKGFNSIISASKELNINYGDICVCCSKKTKKTAGGFIWRYEEDLLESNFLFLPRKNKPILQYDLNNNFIKRWQGVREISKYMDVDIRRIFGCCLYKNKNYKNYIWKYE